MIYLFKKVDVQHNILGVNLRKLFTCLVLYELKQLGLVRIHNLELIKHY